MYCFRKAKPAKCYWNPNKCETGMHSNVHRAQPYVQTYINTLSHSKTATELFYLFDIGVLFGSGLDFFFSLLLNFFSFFLFAFVFSNSICFVKFSFSVSVSLICLFIHSIWVGIAALYAIRFNIIVKQHPNCCNTYIMPIAKVPERKKSIFQRQRKFTESWIESVDGSVSRRYKKN